MEKTLKKYWWVILGAAIVAYLYFKNRQAQTPMGDGSTTDTGSENADVFNPTDNTGIAGGTGMQAPVVQNTGSAAAMPVATFSNMNITPYYVKA